jgi:hypothetical protein
MSTNLSIEQSIPVTSVIPVKALALDLAIKALMDESIPYNWYDSFRCNCGFVARAAISVYYNMKSQGIVGEETLASYLRNSTFAGAENDHDGTVAPSNWTGCWEDKVKYAGRCDTTGDPLPVIFNILFSLGFTSAELIELEDCTLGKGEANAQYKQVLIEYLTEWKQRLS